VRALVNQNLPGLTAGTVATLDDGLAADALVRHRRVTPLDTPKGEAVADVETPADEPAEETTPEPVKARKQRATPAADVPDEASE
jgi:hypothetical protein